ncbi:hypothetical protein RUM43_005667 [Polyplax serrata]|uniref:Mab-21-like HhH/H2TH-like domain-containing protein n=1 Tax=Polyplax serrata TaxID=468196 RepID=A0AAN8PBI3_POLSC
MLNTDASTKRTKTANQKELRDEAKYAEETCREIQENPTNFLLNNILMSIQFFENYERKQKEELLHPLRIFVSNDNIKAAYDPSLFDKFKCQTEPLYLFSVKPCDSDLKEKAGYVFLVEHRTRNGKRLDATCESEVATTSYHYERNQTRQYSPDLKSRRLNATEKLIKVQTKEINKEDKHLHQTPHRGIIPSGSYYKYMKPTVRLNSQPIQEFRMNHEIKKLYDLPPKCFQVVDNRQSRNSVMILSTMRRTQGQSRFSEKTFLNSAALKGYFCDVLLEKLAEPMHLEPNSLQVALVQEEFVKVDQNETRTHITTVIDVVDWNKHIRICRKQTARSERIEWPTNEMNQTVQSLPINVVPTGFPDVTEDRQEYEREWKLDFPKAEEYLSLHMMHSHLRCYLFALVIYKTFIEPEINPISFGSKHLLHHLFWQVRKNFLAWSDDAPGDALLDYLKYLYKRLHNKYLPDFFITSRNLFENARPKDLHRIQSVIKMILDNPVPCIMKAVRNIKLRPGFYKTFDVTRLNTILKGVNTPLAKPKKHNDAMKRVTNDENEDQHRRKNIIKRLQMERKIEVQQQARQSIDSIDIDVVPDVNFYSSSGCELLRFFIDHFLEMGLKSAQYQDSYHADIYLLQAKKLFMILKKFGCHTEITHNDVSQNFKKLSETCAQLRRNTSPK